jgi:hypothetical protein
MAKWRGTEAGGVAIYYPRRAYDMWNTRYFVVPSYVNGWQDEARASAAFRFATELIDPEEGRFAGPSGKEESTKWMETQDFEVLRNEQALPRAGWCMACKCSNGTTRRRAWIKPKPGTEFCILRM